MPLMSWKTGDLLHNLFQGSVSYLYSCVTTTNKAQNYGVSALFLSDFFLLRDFRECHSPKAKKQAKSKTAVILSVS